MQGSKVERLLSAALDDLLVPHRLSPWEYDRREAARGLLWQAEQTEDPDLCADLLYEARRVLAGTSIYNPGLSEALELAEAACG